jgi:integrase
MPRWFARDHDCGVRDLLPRLLALQDRHRSLLIKEEFNQSLAVVHTHRKPNLLSPYNIGMRRGELIKLTWKRSDLKAA